MNTTAAPPPAANEQQIRATLEILVQPGGVVELRALSTDKWGPVVSGYYDNRDKLAGDAARLSQHATGVYVTLNPVNADLRARANNRLEPFAKYTTADRDVTSRRWFLIDLDPVRVPGISATDGEHEAALSSARTIREYLRGLDFSDPVVADSGNGAHLLYRIDLPNDAPATALLRRCLEALDFMFSDTAVAVDRTTYNAARIVRLYGTVARKGDSTRERPHRVSRIVQAPSELVVAPSELLEQLAAKLPEAPKSRSKARGQNAGFDVDKWIAERGVPVVFSGPWGNGQRYVLQVCPWNPTHTNRSAYIVRHASGAVAAGCHHNSCADKEWRDLRDVYEPDWRQHRKSPESIPSNSAGEFELPQAIRDIAVAPDKDIKSFDKRRQIADLIRTEILKSGYLRTTADGRAFFFSKSERRLYDLEQSPFSHFVTQISGLARSESFFRFTLDMLTAEAARTKAVEVHSLAYYELATGLLAVSDGGPGVWVRELAGEWVRTGNGEDGRFFLTEPDAIPFEPVFAAQDRSRLDWYLAQFSFAGRGRLTVDDQRTLLLVNLLHNFFPPLRATRVIPAFLGPQGSGKTTGCKLFGRLLLGPSFDVTGLNREREDAFVAAVTNRTVCALDNADTRVPWLEDALATYATGLRYRMRRLYTTNDEVSYQPRACLMISSRDPRFRRPDVAERLLPFQFERPVRFKPEHAIFTELEKQRGELMGELLTKLATIADGLPSVAPDAVAFRMADFASFGLRISALRGKTHEWTALLGRLESAQAEFASEGDGLVETLRTLLTESPRGIDPITTRELFERCRSVADRERLPFPRTAQSFGQRLANMRRAIELELSVSITDNRGHEGTRYYTIGPRQGDAGDAGDDVRETSSSAEGLR